MTEPQVEAVLGGPRGVYDPALSCLKVTSGEGFGPSGHTSFWHFKGHRIIVSFDAAGRVRDKHVAPPEVAGTAAWAWRRCEEALGLR